MLNRIVVIAVIIYMTLIMPHEAFSIEKAIFKGTILNVKGYVVQGAEVFIYNSPDTRRPADFISARSDAEGGFSIMLPLGNYRAVARLRQGEKYGPLMPGDKHSGEPVELELDRAGVFEQDFTVMDIIEASRLIKKTREDYFKIKGRIKDKKGAPVGNVYAFANRGMEMEGIPDYLSAWTDEKGRYTLYLPAGKYYIGYASEFPPNLQNKVLVEFKVEHEKEGLNITTDYISEPVNNEKIQGQ